MTPLAHRIVNQLMLPKKLRTLNDHAGLLKKMDGIHCFEVTAVRPLINDLSVSIHDGGPVDSRTSFLPAPRTWIELDAYDDMGGARIGYWLEQTSPDSPTAKVITSFWTKNGSHFGAVDVGYICMGGIMQPGYRDPAAPDNRSWTLIAASLALINTPRIIGRKQHMPDRELQRRLLAQKKLIGKFPLRAWTEIKLAVNQDPLDLSEGQSEEAYLTGERALHFCRAHLRLRRGRVEIVRSHWRGNPALGIKQSRYVLTE